MTVFEGDGTERESETLLSVAIIVLNWENYEDTAHCLESLQKISYPNFDVIVVDNGSTDKSGHRIANEFPDYTVLFNDTNSGFAAGNNRGIDKAIRDDYEYILLLNEDTVATGDFLTPLVETMEDHDAAIVGGLITDFESEKIQYAGARFRLLLGGVSCVRTEIKDHRAYTTGYVPGAFMLLSTEFVEENGLLNESYFFGMEDVDAGWVAHKVGREVLVNPISSVQHKGGITHSSNSPFWVYHQTRNRLQFASGRLGRWEMSVFYPAFLVTMFARMIQWLTESSWDLVHAGVVAIIDHLRSNEPKRYEWFE